MPQRFSTIILHLLGWSLFLGLLTVVPIGKRLEWNAVFRNVHELQYLLSWLLLIGFTYLHHLWIVPRFYFPKKWVAYGGLVVVGFMFTNLLPEITDFFINPPAPPPFDLETRPQLDRLYHPPSNEFRLNRPPSQIYERSHFLLLFIISTLVSVSYQTQLRLRQMEKQRLQIELRNLRGQIQPHFLFNTLNSIYSLALRQDERTADTVVQLSEFLRYIIRDTSDEVVPLVKEVAYLHNYIDLQQARLRGTVEIEFTTTGNFNNHQIAPLILFSFIENAFQHGVSPAEPSIIKIELTTMLDQIKLLVYNRKVKQRADNDHSGIGLTNTQARLQMLYPQQHDLKITETATDFQVDLTLQIK